MYSLHNAFTTSLIDAFSVAFRRCNFSLELYASLLDVELVGTAQPMLYCLIEHKSPLTGLITMSGYSMSMIISSSLDGSLKVGEL